MAIYFIIENEDLMNQRIKIGFSNNLANRLRTLQTGNSRKLALMGWIESNDDRKLEKQLHEKYSACQVLNEWYEIHNEIVIDELKNSGTNGYIALQSNSGKFLGCDKNGVPDFMEPWEWSSLDLSEFCPDCGSSCGLHYNENYGGERCLKCGFTV